MILLAQRDNNIQYFTNKIKKIHLRNQNKNTQFCVNRNFFGSFLLLLILSLPLCCDSSHFYYITLYYIDLSWDPLGAPNSHIGNHWTVLTLQYGLIKTAPLLLTTKETYIQS